MCSTFVINNVISNMGKYDLIIGSRHMKDSVLVQKQPLIRQFIGYMCRKLVNMKFHMHYKDTQCGFKAIRTDYAKEFAKRQIELSKKLNKKIVILKQKNICFEFKN